MQQGTRLELSQRQELTVTPQMQQAIEILLMSALELELHVRQELQNNPVIELDESENQIEENENESEIPTAEKEENEISDEEETEKEEIRGNESSDIDEVDYANLFSTPDSKREKEENDDKYFAIEQNSNNAVSLPDFLLEQLRTTEADDEIINAVKFLITRLDADGYIKEDIEVLKELSGYSSEIIKNALGLLKSFEPAGIGASDLKECLLIQLEKINKKDSLEWNIVLNHIDNVSKNKIPEIASSLNIEISEVYEAINFIKTLEPRPGRAFGTEETAFIVPDVIVEKIDGEYVVSLRNDRIPNLRISDYYIKLYEKERKKKGEVSEYLKSKIDSALWLVRSIEQRQKTIFRVAESIVRYQTDFLEYGPKYLKPLTLKVIAEEIGVHESTVSRVTTNKYIETPRGTFELKYFFSTGIGTDSGEETSSKAIRTIIGELIENEDKKNPLSDQKLTEMLNSRGFTIARRTVTKYREELKIPSAKLRIKY